MQNVKTIEKMEIPEKMPEHDWNNYALRQRYVQEGMFGFVSWKWVNPFVKWLNGRKCLEVMAGRGWLSYALQQKGVQVIATDDFSWHQKEDYTKWNDTLVPIENLDAVEAVKKYGKDVDVVLMSWPFMDDTAYEVLKALHTINPNAILVYIGEGKGGCTASNLFFDHFIEVPDEEFLNQVFVNYERWFGVYDEIRIGKYSPKKKETII